MRADVNILVQQQKLLLAYLPVVFILLFLKFKFLFLEKGQS